MITQDLTKYENGPYVYDNVLCVGWIDGNFADAGADMPKDSEIAKLKRLILKRTEKFDLHVEVMRGIHPCNFCGKEIAIYPDEIIRNRKDATWLGMSEIWIPYEFGWYACPSLVLHYVTDHQYKPPNALWTAVANVSLDSAVIAQDAYEAELSACISNARS